MITKLEEIGSYFPSEGLPILLILGVIILLAYAGGRGVKKLKLPTILAYLLSGVLLGPSVLGILNDELLGSMDFVVQGCLAFIAFRIGLEFDMKELKREGKGLAFTTLSESLLAVILVVFGVWAISGELFMGLALGALAPATAPAGTIAVIEEYRAKGRLTEVLYSVVGIDDALGILLFGLISPFVIILLGGSELGVEGTMGLFLHSLEEVFLSLILGLLFAQLFILLNKEKMKNFRVLLLTFGFILLLSGIAQLMGASLILANMLFGLGVGQWGSGRLRELEEEDLGVILPFFFILFFTIAGADLHIKSLWGASGTVIVYILFRSIGKYFGARIGTALGGFEKRVRGNLGFGLLSQAGVAIGLALMLRQNIEGLGPMVSNGMSLGDQVGNAVFTTVTASSVVFEFFGPILAKFGLKRAGEIHDE